MKTRNITKWLMASMAFGLVSFATERANAILEMSYTTDSPNLLGTVLPGQVSPPGQAEHDAAMTNFLLGMASQTHITSNGSFYSRTTWPGGNTASSTGAVVASGFSDGTTAISIDLSQFGTFQYLVATYGDKDDPNGGVAVWNISGLTGTIQIYRYAKPQIVNGHYTGNLVGRNTAQPGCYLITSWTLLNPTGVPDGGATALLLGFGLGAVALGRRCLASS
jgi:hypothetical protein